MEIKRIRIAAICVTCGNNFMARKDHILRGGGRFCSHGCVIRNIRKRRTVEYSSTAERVKAWKKRQKLKVLEHYGGAICKCCGETGFEFLTIDHINGDGAKHRKEIGNKGRRMWSWLKKNGYPPGFQVLCYNCNIASYWNNGICPHKKTA